MAHQELDMKACRIAATLPGCLVFNTTVASGDSGLLRTNSAIYDVEGQVLGSLARGWPDQIFTQRPPRNNRDALDFIVLCASVDSAYTSSDSNLIKSLADDMWWWLCVMLVERISASPYVVRRVEVGQIYMAKWKNCNPRWKTVVLC
ncbi:heterokaryon incompatibility protein-domain-containing protein [Apiospora arundinis]|uniref:Heterokaryon incompatibility protein-domain-containing protein n=1 Tax=Apiospora arundinis TaxID=335852 RepID=A0ABR2IJL4_9PEZI